MSSTEFQIIEQLVDASKCEEQVETILYCAVKSCLITLDEANKIGEEFGVEIP